MTGKVDIPHAEIQAARGRTIRQVISAGEGWCLAGVHGPDPKAHFPVIAWALVDDPGFDSMSGREDLVPVYVDEAPHVMWPSNPQWQNCEVVAHRAGHGCIEADAAVARWAELA